MNPADLADRLDQALVAVMTVRVALGGLPGQPLPSYQRTARTRPASTSHYLRWPARIASRPLDNAVLARAPYPLWMPRALPSMAAQMPRCEGRGV